MATHTLTFKFYRVDFRGNWQLSSSSVPASDQVFKYTLRQGPVLSDDLPPTVTVYYQATAGMAKTAVVKCTGDVNVFIHNDVIHLHVEPNTNGSMVVTTTLNDNELG